MPPMATGPDILIIGGGIIGLTAALKLVKARVRVAVYDRGEFGMEASWAGAGIIPPGDPATAVRPIDKLRAITAAKMPRLALKLKVRTDIDPGYRVTGGIEFLTKADAYALKLWRDEGIRFKRVSPIKMRTLEPCFGTAHGTPFRLREMAQVRNPRHLRALAAECRRKGVELHANSPVAWALSSSGQVKGVRLADDSIVSAGRYLVAAGAWGESLLSPLGCRPGVLPVRGQIVLFRTPQRVLNHILLVGKEYLVPRADGRVLAGSTEEPEAGFEKANTPEGVNRLIAFAQQCVPALQEVETTWSGLRPGSPDGMPFIGPVPGHPTVFAAVGHFRAGVQLSIGTAELVRDLILGRTPTVPADAFRLDRVPDPTALPAFRS